MTRQPSFYHWHKQLVKVFVQPGVLSLAQATGLALFTFGLVRAGCCALNHIAAQLTFAGSDNTVLQRLKYWLRDGKHKRTPQEPQIDVHAVFPALVQWVLSFWQGAQVALAFDATTLHDDLLIVALCLLYRGTAIPLAWAILPANRKQPWRPLLLDLLATVAQVVPADYQVVVLADRGLYSPVLYRAICQVHWHPLLRVNNQAYFRPHGQAWRPLTGLLAEAGSQWRAPGHFAKGTRLDCTLLAYWAPGQKDIWFLITDLPPEAVHATWYGLRVWIEEGFRILKSMGWQWQQSRITDPQRAERLWLALTVATVWVLLYGTWAEDQRLGPPTARPHPAPGEPAPPAATPPEPVAPAAALPEPASPEPVPPAAASPATTRPEPTPSSAGSPAPQPSPDPFLSPVETYISPTRRRQKSIFRQGQVLLIDYVWGDKSPLPNLRLVPEPWPGGAVKNG